MKTWTIIDEKIFDLVKPENFEDEALKNVLKFLIPSRCYDRDFFAPIRVFDPFQDVMTEISLHWEKYDVTSIP